MNKNFLYIAVCIAIFLAASIIYFVFQNNKQLLSTASPTTNQQDRIQSRPPTPLPSINQKNIKEIIKSSVNSKNYASLEPYLIKPKVNFSLMSSGCCEPQTPSQAMNQLSYIDKGVPLDFNQNSELVKNLKSKNPQLADAFIGISQTTEHLAAFTINDQNLITAIQLSVSWKLYNN